MRKILISLLLLLGLVGCTKGPEETVAKFLDSVKESNVKVAADLAIDKELVKNLKHNFSNNMQKLLFNTLTDNFSYEILNSTKDSDGSYIVNVEIKNIDVQDLLQELFHRSIQKAFTGNKNVDIEFEMLTLIEEKDFKMIKIVDQYVVKKVGRKYKVDVSSVNIDNIYGNYYSSISNIKYIGK